MSKLSLEALRMRAESIVSEELMVSISGGTANACHNKKDVKIKDEREDAIKVKDNIPTQPAPPKH